MQKEDHKDDDLRDDVVQTKPSDDVKNVLVDLISVENFATDLDVKTAPVNSPKTMAYFLKTDRCLLLYSQLLDLVAFEIAQSLTQDVNKSGVVDEGEPDAPTDKHKLEEKTFKNTPKLSFLNTVHEGLTKRLHRFSNRNTFLVEPEPEADRIYEDSTCPSDGISSGTTQESRSTNLASLGTITATEASEPSVQMKEAQLILPQLLQTNRKSSNDCSSVVSDGSDVENTHEKISSSLQSLSLNTTISRRNDATKTEVSSLDGSQELTPLMHSCDTDADTYTEGTVSENLQEPNFLKKWHILKPPKLSTPQYIFCNLYDKIITKRKKDAAPIFQSKLQINEEAKRFSVAGISSIKQHDVTTTEAMQDGSSCAGEFHSDSSPVPSSSINIPEKSAAVSGTVPSTSLEDPPALLEQDSSENDEMSLAYILLSRLLVKIESQYLLTAPDISRRARELLRQFSTEYSLSSSPENSNGSSDALKNLFQTFYKDLLKKIGLICLTGNVEALQESTVDVSLIGSLGKALQQHKRSTATADSVKTEDSVKEKKTGWARFFTSLKSKKNFKVIYSSLYL